MQRLPPSAPAFPAIALLRALLAALGLALSLPATADTNLVVAGAWLREPPPGVDAAAAYLTVHNAGTTALRLTGAASPLARTVTLHDNLQAGGMARMRQLAHIDLPAGGSIEFKPGGRHIMLQGLAHALRAGERVPLVLLFADGSRLSATALVVPLGAH